MVENALRERLAGGLRAEIRVEAERLGHGQVRLDVVQRGARALVLLEHVAAAPVEARVDAAKRRLRALDLDQEHGLHELGRRDHLRGVHDAARRRDDLASASVDGVRVHRHVEDLEADAAHVLLADHALLGHPVEAGHHGILDLRQVLHGLGRVNHEVRADNVGAERPDLARHVDVPAEVVGKAATADLDIVTRGDVAGVDEVGEVLAKGQRLEVEAVVLVGRLGHALLVRLGLDRLTVRHNGVRDLERGTVHVVVLEILEADLHVELAGAGDNVLSRLLDRDDNHRIRLGEALETLDKLGQILGVLGLDGAAHNGRHRELHVLHRVRVLVGGDGSGLDQELVDANHTARVSDGHVLDGVLPPAHEEHNALDRLDVEVVLLALLVVGAHDADLDSGLHGSGEHTAEGDEAALVGSGNHLGDVEHEGALRVALADGGAARIVGGAGVEELRAVLLGGVGGREMEDHHLEERLVRRQPVLHGALEKLLALELEVLLLHLDVERGKHLVELVHLLIHASLNDLADRVEHEHVERAEVRVARLGPLLLSRVEVVLAPKTLTHLLLSDAELLGVHAGELGEGEGPAVETGREADGTLLGVHLEISHGLVTVGGDDHVDVLDVLDEVAVERLPVELQLKEATIELVDGHNRPDALSESLAKHSLGLDRHALDTVDHHKSSVRDAESRSHLRREINVTWGIDKVDEELATLGILGHSLVRDLLLRDLVVKRDTGGLDGDATLGLIGTSVSKTLVSRRSHGDDTSRRHERVREGGLAVVNVSNHRHVANVLRLVHDSPQLRECEVHHCSELGLRSSLG
mmetsp:Transcript_34805/g.25142  ORF Transcript_34805/g.25142 Transcript_34805/m.25142 type:complete len:810 (-) Transcript_34805:10-2439(-)